MNKDTRRILRMMRQGHRLLYNGTISAGLVLKTYKDGTFLIEVQSIWDIASLAQQGLIKHEDGRKDWELTRRGKQAK